MLVEIKDVRQIPNEGFRRWFRDREFDLIVWYEDNAVSGFQLCYDKTGLERALTWHKEDGYSHNKIDDGENPFSNKMAPILVADGVFKKAEVAKSFKQHAAQIEEDLVESIYTRIMDYS